MRNASHPTTQLDTVPIEPLDQTTLQLLQTSGENAGGCCGGTACGIG
ncbi:hypothetical protein [Microbacterium sp. GXF7504]